MFIFIPYRDIDKNIFPLKYAYKISKYEHFHLNPLK